jgi:hypothetical protein
MDEIATINEAKELLYTSWLAILLIIVLMIFKWRLGLYGILEKAIDWITGKNQNHKRPYNSFLVNDQAKKHTLFFPTTPS